MENKAEKDSFGHINEINFNTPFKTIIEKLLPVSLTSCGNITVAFSKDALKDLFHIEINIPIPPKALVIQPEVQKDAIDFRWIGIAMIVIAVINILAIFLILLVYFLLHNRVSKIERSVK